MYKFDFYLRCAQCLQWFIIIGGTISRGQNVVKSAGDAAAQMLLSSLNTKVVKLYSKAFVSSPVSRPNYNINLLFSKWQINNIFLESIFIIGSCIHTFIVFLCSNLLILLQLVSISMLWGCFLYFSGSVCRTSHLAWALKLSFVNSLQELVWTVAHAAPTAAASPWHTHTHTHSHTHLSASVGADGCQRDTGHFSSDGLRFKKSQREEVVSVSLSELDLRLFLAKCYFNSPK